MITAALISAMLAIECPSGSDRQQFLDGGDMAYGCLCIHQAAIDDVNRICGTRLTPEDMLDRPTAIKACLVYLNYYCTPERLGHYPTEEDYARTWVGGPLGIWKTSTLPYWLKVKHHLEQAAMVAEDVR